MKTGERLIKSIALLTLVCFVYTSVLHQSLYAITEKVSDNKRIQEISSKLDAVVLPPNLGRVVESSYFNNDRLVIYIQDLHCHAEVQKNICNLIEFFDAKHPINKLFVEGAASGPVDTSFIRSIPDEKIRKAAVENLMAKGLMSGVEYYAVTHDKNNLYGIEDWNTYLSNLNRITKLLENKDKNTNLSHALSSHISALKKRYLSKEIAGLENSLLKQKKVTGKGEEYYKKLSKLATETDENLIKYPEISKYIRIIELKEGIKFKKLAHELRAYVNEIKSVIPFSIFQKLSEKLNKSSDYQEYYNGLHLISNKYTPHLQNKYPNVDRFLEYTSLNFTLNPIHLIKEEKVFMNQVLSKKADRMIDKELLFLAIMADKFGDFVLLKASADDYKYYIENTKRFELLLKRYFHEASFNPEPIINLIHDKSYTEYYQTNIRRNDLFLSCVALESENSTPLASEFAHNESSMANIKDFKCIDIIVAGGFHSEITREFKEKGISYISITPNITKPYDEKLYEHVITGTLDTELNVLFSGSGLAPIIAGWAGVKKRDPAYPNKEFLTLVASVVSAVLNEGEYKDKSEQEFFNAFSGLMHTWLNNETVQKYELQQPRMYFDIAKNAYIIEIKDSDEKGHVTQIQISKDHTITIADLTTEAKALRDLQEHRGRLGEEKYGILEDLYNDKRTKAFFVLNTLYWSTMVGLGVISSFFGIGLSVTLVLVNPFNDPVTAFITKTLSVIISMYISTMPEIIVRFIMASGVSRAYGLKFHDWFWGFLASTFPFFIGEIFALPVHMLISYRNHTFWGRFKVVGIVLTYELQNVKEDVVNGSVALMRKIRSIAVTLRDKVSSKKNGRIQHATMAGIVLAALLTVGIGTNGMLFGLEQVNWVLMGVSGALTVFGMPFILTFIIAIASVVAIKPPQLPAGKEFADTLDKNHDIELLKMVKYSNIFDNNSFQGYKVVYEQTQGFNYLTERIDHDRKLIIINRRWVLKSNFVFTFLRKLILPIIMAHIGEHGRGKGEVPAYGIMPLSFYNQLFQSLIHPFNQKQSKPAVNIENTYNPDIILYETHEELVIQAAKKIADLIRNNNEKGVYTVIGFFTGSTPIPLYNELVRLHREEGLDFSNVITFNLDEYAGLGKIEQGKGDSQSYYEYMHHNLFNHINIDPANVHILDGKAKDFDKECRAYERLIAQCGGIDLQGLGIGRDGHTAFNEPAVVVNQKFAGNLNIIANMKTDELDTLLKQALINQALIKKHPEQKLTDLEEVILQIRNHNDFTIEGIPSNYFKDIINKLTRVRQIAREKMNLEEEIKTAIPGLCDSIEEFNGRADELLSLKTNYDLLSAKVLNQPITIFVAKSNILQRALLKLKNPAVTIKDASFIYLSRTRVVNLAISTIIDNQIYYNNLEKMPVSALTMGVGTINDAHEIMQVANKDYVAPAIGSLLEGPVTSEVISTFLKLRNAVTLFLARPAAKYLSTATLKKATFDTKYAEAKQLESTLRWLKDNTAKADALSWDNAVGLVELHLNGLPIPSAQISGFIAQLRAERTLTLAETSICKAFYGELITVMNDDNTDVIGITDRSFIHRFALPHQTASAFVLTPDGQLLFQRRTHQSEEPYSLSIFGGHTSTGHTPQEGIEKELLEELGLDSQDKLYGELVQIGENGQFIEKSENDREFRSFFVYKMTDQEYRQINKKKEKLRRIKKSFKSIDGFKVWLETEQQKHLGYGEVWDYVKLDLDKLLNGESVSILDTVGKMSTLTAPEFTKRLLAPLLKDAALQKAGAPYVSVIGSLRLIKDDLTNPNARNYANQAKDKDREIIKVYTDKGTSYIEKGAFPKAETYLRIVNPPGIADAEFADIYYDINSSDDFKTLLELSNLLRTYTNRNLKMRLHLSRSPYSENGLHALLQDHYEEILYLDKGIETPFTDENQVKPLYLSEGQKKKTVWIQEVFYQHERLYKDAKDASEALRKSNGPQKMLIDKHNSDNPLLWSVKVPENIEGKDIQFIHSCENNKDIAELFVILIALRRARVGSITLINAYEAYSRQDKIFTYGEGVPVFTMLNVIHNLVDNHLSFNEHFNKIPGFVSFNLKEQIRASAPFIGRKKAHLLIEKQPEFIHEIYNLDGFIQIAEKMFETLKEGIIGDIQDTANPEAREKLDALQKYFNEHPILLIGPHYGALHYTKSAVPRLKSYIKEKYGIDVAVQFGYLDAEEKGEDDVKLYKNAVLTDKQTYFQATIFFLFGWLFIDILHWNWFAGRVNVLLAVNKVPIKNGFAFILNDEISSGKTIQIAANALVKKLGFSWARTLAGAVHGKFTKGMAPLTSQFSKDEVLAALRDNRQLKPDYKGYAMPPALLFATESFTLPQDFPYYGKVSIGSVARYVVRNIYGKGIVRLNGSNARVTRFEFLINGNTIILERGIGLKGEGNVVAYKLTNEHMEFLTAADADQLRSLLAQDTLLKNTVGINTNKAYYTSEQLERILNEKSDIRNIVRKILQEYLDDYESKVALVKRKKDTDFLSVLRNFKVLAAARDKGDITKADYAFTIQGDPVIAEGMNSFIAYRGKSVVRRLDIIKMIGQRILKEVKGFVPVTEKSIVIPIYRGALWLQEAVAEEYGRPSNIYCPINTRRVKQMLDGRIQETLQLEGIENAENNIKGNNIVLLDTTIVTGTTLAETIELLLQKSPKRIAVMSLYAVPEGIEYLAQKMIEWREKGLLKNTEIRFHIGTQSAPADISANWRWAKPFLGDVGDELLGDSSGSMVLRIANNLLAKQLSRGNKLWSVLRNRKFILSIKSTIGEQAESSAKGVQKTSVQGLLVSATITVLSAVFLTLKGIYDANSILLGISIVFLGATVVYLAIIEGSRIINKIDINNPIDITAQTLIDNSTCVRLAKEQGYRVEYTDDTNVVMERSTDGKTFENILLINKRFILQGSPYQNRLRLLLLPIILAHEAVHFSILQLPNPGQNAYILFLNEIVPYAIMPFSIPASLHTLFNATSTQNSDILQSSPQRESFVNNLLKHSRLAAFARDFHLSYLFIEDIYGDKTFPSGETYVEHYAAMASNVALWGGNKEAVIAALCAGCTPTELKRLQVKTAPQIAQRIEVFNAAQNTLLFPDEKDIVSFEGEQTLQNYLDFTLQTVRDYQELLIICASKLQAIQANDDPNKRRQAFFEIVYVYAPLIDRLGAHSKTFSHLKDEAFRLISLHPEDGFYGQYGLIKSGIENILGEKLENLDSILLEMETRIEQELKTQGIKADIYFRTKSVYSTWEKQNTSRRDEYTSIDDIMDYLGLRVVTDDTRAVAVIESFLEKDSSIHVSRNKVFTVEKNGFAMNQYRFTRNRLRYELQICGEDYILEMSLGDVKLLQHWVYKFGANESKSGNTIRQRVEFPVINGETITQSFDQDEIYVAHDPAKKYELLLSHNSKNSYAINVSKNKKLSVVKVRNLSLIEKLLLFAGTNRFVLTTPNPRQTNELVRELRDAFGSYAKRRWISGKDGVIQQIVLDPKVQLMINQEEDFIARIELLKPLLPKLVMKDIAAIDLMRGYAEDESDPLRAVVAQACMNALLPKKMSVAFVNLFDASIMPSSIITPPVGLWQMIGYMKRRLSGEELDIKLYDMRIMNRRNPIKYVAKEIIRTRPQMLGVSMFLESLPLMEELMKELSKHLSPEEMPILFFGKNIPTIAPHELLADIPQALLPKTVVVQGEGEHAIIEWVNFFLGKGGLDNVTNSIYKYGEEVRETDRVRIGANAEGELDAEGLDELGLPDHTDLDKYVELNNGQMDVELHRGCPWAACTFCAIMRIWGGKKDKQTKRGIWTHKSVDHFIEELKVLKSRGVKRVMLTDEEFLDSDPEHIQFIIELAQRIIDEKLDMAFYTNARTDSVIVPDSADPEADTRLRELIHKQLVLLKRAGFTKFFVGIESGSDTQLKRFGKGVKNALQQEAIDYLANHPDLQFGLEFGFLMFDPMVSRQELKDNIAFIRKNKFYPHLNLVRVYKGSGLEMLIRHYEKKHPDVKILGDLSLSFLDYKIENFMDPDVKKMYDYCEQFAGDETPYYKFYSDFKTNVRFQASFEMTGLTMLFEQRLAQIKEFELELLERLLEASPEEMEGVYQDMLKKRDAVLMELLDVLKGRREYASLYKKARKLLLESEQRIMTGGKAWLEVLRETTLPELLSDVAYYLKNILPSSQLGNAPGKVLATGGGIIFMAVTALTYFVLQQLSNTIGTGPLMSNVDIFIRSSSALCSGDVYLAAGLSAIVLIGIILTQAYRIKSWGLRNAFQWKYFKMDIQHLLGQEVSLSSSNHIAFKRYITSFSMIDTRDILWDPFSKTTQLYGQSLTRNSLEYFMKLISVFQEHGANGLLKKLPETLQNTYQLQAETIDKINKAIEDYFKAVKVPYDETKDVKDIRRIRIINRTLASQQRHLGLFTALSEEIVTILASDSNYSITAENFTIDYLNNYKSSIVEFFERLSHHAGKLVKPDTTLNDPQNFKYLVLNPLWEPVSALVGATILNLAMAQGSTFAIIMGFVGLSLNAIIFAVLHRVKYRGIKGAFSPEYLKEDAFQFVNHFIVSLIFTLPFFFLKSPVAWLVSTIIHAAYNALVLKLTSLQPEILPNYLRWITRLNLAAIEPAKKNEHIFLTVRGHKIPINIHMGTAESLISANSIFRVMKEIDSYLENIGDKTLFEPLLHGEEFNGKFVGWIMDNPAEAEGADVVIEQIMDLCADVIATLARLTKEGEIKSYEGTVKPIDNWKNINTIELGGGLMNDKYLRVLLAQKLKKRITGIDVLFIDSSDLAGIVGASETVPKKERRNNTVIGIDVGGTSVKLGAVVYDEKGNVKEVREFRRIQPSLSDGPETYYAEIARNVDKLRSVIENERLHVSPHIGLCHPGKPSRNGKILDGTNPNMGFHGINPAKMIQKKYSHWINDAHAQAIKGYEFSKHKVKNAQILFVGFGTGLGTAFIETDSNGDIIRHQDSHIQHDPRIGKDIQLLHNKKPQKVHKRSAFIERVSHNNFKATAVISVFNLGAKFDKVRSIFVFDEALAFKHLMKYFETMGKNLKDTATYLFGLRKPSPWSKYLHGLDYKELWQLQSNGGNLSSYLNSIRTEYAIDNSWEVQEASMIDSVTLFIKVRYHVPYDFKIVPYIMPAEARDANAEVRLDYIRRHKTEFGIAKDQEVVEADNNSLLVKYPLPADSLQTLSGIIGYDVKKKTYTLNGRDVSLRDSYGNPFSPTNIDAPLWFMKRNWLQNVINKLFRNNIFKNKLQIFIDKAHVAGNRVIVDGYAWRSPDCLTSQNYKYFIHDEINLTFINPWAWALKNAFPNDPRTEPLNLDSFTDLELLTIMRKYPREFKDRSGVIFYPKPGHRVIVYFRGVGFGVPDVTADQLMPDYGYARDDYQDEKFTFWKLLYLQDYKALIDAGCEGVRLDLVHEMKSHHPDSIREWKEYYLLYTIIQEAVAYAHSKGQRFYINMETYDGYGLIKAMADARWNEELANKYGYYPIKLYDQKLFRSIKERNDSHFLDTMKTLIEDKNEQEAFTKVMYLAQYDDESLADLIPNEALRNQFLEFYIYLAKAGFNVMFYFRDIVGIEEIFPVVGGDQNENGEFLTHKIASLDEINAWFASQPHELLQKSRFYSLISDNNAVTHVEKKGGIVYFTLENTEEPIPFNIYDMFNQLRRLDEVKEGIPEKLWQKLPFKYITSTSWHMLKPSRFINGLVRSITGNDREERADRIAKFARVEGKNKELARDLASKEAIVFIPETMQENEVKTLVEKRDRIGLRTLPVKNGPIENVQSSLLAVAMGNSTENYDDYIFARLSYDSQSGILYYDVLPEYLEQAQKPDLQARIMYALAQQLNENGLIAQQKFGKNVWAIEYPAEYAKTFEETAKLYPALEAISKPLATATSDLKKHMGAYQLLKTKNNGGVSDVTKITIKVPVKNADLDSLIEFARQNPIVGSIIIDIDAVDERIKGIKDRLSSMGVQLIVSLPDIMMHKGSLLNDTVCRALLYSDVLIDASSLTTDELDELYAAIEADKKIPSNHNILCISNNPHTNALIREKYGFEVIAAAKSVKDAQGAVQSGNGVCITVTDDRGTFNTLKTICDTSMSSPRLVLDITSMKDATKQGFLESINFTGTGDTIGLISLFDLLLGLLPRSKVVTAPVRLNMARNQIWSAAEGVIFKPESRILAEKIKESLRLAKEIDTLLNSVNLDKEKESIRGILNLVKVPINQMDQTSNNPRVNERVDAIKILINAKTEEILREIEATDNPEVIKIYLKEYQVMLFSLFGLDLHHIVNDEITDVNSLLDGLYLKDINRIVHQIQNGQILLVPDTFKAIIPKISKRLDITDEDSWVLLGEMLLFMVRDRENTVKLSEELAISSTESIREILCAG